MTSLEDFLKETDRLAEAIGHLKLRIEIALKKSKEPKPIEERSESESERIFLWLTEQYSPSKWHNGKYVARDIAEAIRIGHWKDYTGKVRR